MFITSYQASLFNYAYSIFLERINSFSKIISKEEEENDIWKWLKTRPKFKIEEIIAQTGPNQFYLLSLKTIHKIFKKICPKVDYNMIMNDYYSLNPKQKPQKIEINLDNNQINSFYGKLIHFDVLSKHAFNQIYLIKKGAEEYFVSKTDQYGGFYFTKKETKFNHVVEH